MLLWVLYCVHLSFHVKYIFTQFSLFTFLSFYYSFFLVNPIILRVVRFLCVVPLCFILLVTMVTCS